MPIPLFAALVVFSGLLQSPVGGTNKEQDKSQGKVGHKTIVVMDSIENKDATGKPYLKTIEEVLSSIPGVKVLTEEVGPQWNRDQQVIASKPDLIILHINGFTHGGNDASGQTRMVSFLGQLRGSKMPFLLYSRSSSLESQPAREYVISLFTEYTKLPSSRFRTIALSRGERPRQIVFPDKRITEELKQLVLDVFKANSTPPPSPSPKKKPDTKARKNRGASQGGKNV